VDEGGVKALDHRLQDLIGGAVHSDAEFWQRAPGVSMGLSWRRGLGIVNG
jgi:hypothetical protein